MTYLLDLCDPGYRHVVFILPITLPVRCTIAYCRVLTACASANCSSRASSLASSANFCFLKVHALCTSAPTFALPSNFTLFRHVTGRSVTSIDCIQSASFQKSRARQKAFIAWEHEFGLEQCLAQFCLRWMGDSGEGHAHREKIILEPPLVANHPLWSAATDVERDKHG
jgi:hypothetical protein